MSIPPGLPMPAPADRIDVSQYLAFRPKAFGLSATPGLDSPLVITGVNFLESFRVELDWANQRVALTSRRVPSYPRQDFAFFEAESRGTARSARTSRSTRTSASVRRCGAVGEVSSKRTTRRMPTS